MRNDTWETTTMSEAIHDLREAAHRLTHPQTRLMWQGGGHDHEWQPVTDRQTRERTGEYKCSWCDQLATAPDHAPAGTKVVKQVDEPLLDQLAAAVASDLGKSATRGSSRSSVPIDIGALQLVGQIDERVRAWLHDMGARSGGKVSLRELVSSWLVLYSAGQHEDGEVDNYRRVLDGWETAIRDTLSPNKRIELLSACPACGQEFINVGLTDDPNDIEMVRVLNAVEAETLDESYAMCKACDQVWMGVARMRALRIAIDEAQTTKEAS